MKEAPKYFDAELPPRIYGKVSLPISIDDDIPPTITSRDIGEREIGLSTRNKIAVFVLLMGAAFVGMNGTTLVKCIEDHIVCEWE